MSFDYGMTRATATRLIQRFGQRAVLRRPAESGAPWNPTRTPTDVDITAVDLDEEVRDRSGALVGQTQRRLLVSARVGVTPTKADTVSIPARSATFHQVSEVRPLAPGGSVLMWTLDLVS